MRALQLRRRPMTSREPIAPPFKCSPECLAGIGRSPTLLQGILDVAESLPARFAWNHSLRSKLSGLRRSESISPSGVAAALLLVENDNHEMDCQIARAAALVTVKNHDPSPELNPRECIRSRRMATIAAQTPVMSSSTAGETGRVPMFTALASWFGLLAIREWPRVDRTRAAPHGPSPVPVPAA